jgi:hypothetical protein
VSARPSGKVNAYNRNYFFLCLKGCFIEKLDLKLGVKLGKFKLTLGGLSVKQAMELGVC